MPLNWIFWIIAVFVFLIGELFTTSFFLMWFAIGAGVALLTSLLGVNNVVQLIVFAIVSGILVLNSHKIVKKYIEKDGVDTKTTVDALAGRVGTVLQTIDNSENSGLVRLGGEQWSATSVDDNIVITKGSKVEVLKVDGVRLIVKLKEEKGED